MAAKFLGNDPEEAEVKKLIGDIKGVYVRGLKFEKEGEYSLADVEAIRSQLQGPSWFEDRRCSAAPRRTGTTPVST